ncbi:unnamed protein product [Cuscuta campestris]|uniref:Wound-induced protein 1 n=1 Tax=Cuscuta campestris TaxID=132261 RepID=A0A484LVM7_9ASTE|nr:unnamed protein product [Cuscuta campestris]
MRVLTGAAPPSSDSFRFVPLTVDAIGPTVFVEGCDSDRNITWVHAWTVTDGIITQVREYFNTSLTVTRLGTRARSAPAAHCPSVWESSLSNRVGKSVPGLVLAI